MAQPHKFVLRAFALGLLLLLLQTSLRNSAAAIRVAPTSTIRPAAPPSPSVTGPFVGAPVAAGSFDGDVRRLPRRAAPPAARQAPVPRRALAGSAAAASPRDPVRQAQAGRRQAQGAALENFDGLASTGWYPPDPNGDVGPNDYVQGVNDSIGIYSKTGSLLASFSFDSLFSGVPPAGNPCGSGNNAGDIVVLYDATIDRWFAADMGWAIDGSNNSVGPYYECIAMTKTADPTQSWWLYALPITDPPGDNTVVNGDYAKFAIWPDAIYMTADLDGGSSSQDVRVWALNRSDLMNGNSLDHVSFDIGTPYVHVLPANLRGSTPPPSGEPALFASIDQPSTLHLWKFHVDWTTPANSTFTGPTDLTVAAFAMPCDAAATLACVPESGGESIDALGDRLMAQLQYRNFAGTESLWANHSIAASANVGSPIGIRWYEIRDPNGSPTIVQQGTYQPDSSYRWLGSLAVDKFGDMALGYSVSSATMQPAIRYAGRLSSDPGGSLCQAETTLVQGTGSQNGDGNRWGDYSAMTIDPADDLTFWYTNMYYSSTGPNWKTRIGSFRLGSAPSAAGPYVYYFPFVAKAGAAGC